MSYVLDTNVLLRFVQLGHPMQEDSEKAIETLRQNGEALYLLPQNLIEFWAVATRPHAYNGLNLTFDEAAQQLTNLKSLFLLHLDKPSIYAEWESLITQYQVKGRQVHDARIVAAMNVHTIANLLTFNTDDFKRYTEINAVDPREITKP
ncbi:MAG: type II toxin-antitoxin system VapC family toxin [Acidobacteriota bacterium]